jgi:hypothetical protein
MFGNKGFLMVKEFVVEEFCETKPLHNARPIIR